MLESRGPRAPRQGPADLPRLQRDGECIGLTPAERRAAGWRTNWPNFLRTGDAPPAGVIVTQGIGNFLALAAHWDDDDENAPAILAGPMIGAPGGSCCGHRRTARPITRSSWPACPKWRRVLVARPSKPVCFRPSRSTPRRSSTRASPSGRFSTPTRKLGMAYYFGDQIRYVSDWSSFSGMVGAGRAIGRRRSRPQGRARRSPALRGHRGRREVGATSPNHGQLAAMDEPRPKAAWYPNPAAVVDPDRTCSTSETGRSTSIGGASGPQ